jgi:hydroxyacylglutathione hydrolase
MSGKPSSTIAFEKRWNPLLELDVIAFVDEVGGKVPPKPADMDAILRYDQGRA